MGDTSLTVHNGQCVARNLCSCRQKLWIFKADKTDKGFAIYFELERDEITAIHRCFGHYNNDKEMTQLNDVFNYEGNFVHEHEKIGFIDTYELKETRRKVKLFMADMGNPRRHTVGVIGIKRMVRKYNSLFFDVVYQPDLYEYKIAMHNIYEDLCNLKNIFRLNGINRC